MSIIPQQAAHDEQMIALWLHGRSERTQRAYTADIARFLAFVGKPLPAVTLGDMQAFADSLAHLAPNSRKRTLSAVKSLLSKAQKIGYLQFASASGSLVAHTILVSGVSPKATVKVSPYNQTTAPWPDKPCSL